MILEDLYNMKLHSVINEPYIQITRVPGGWIYQRYEVINITVDNHGYIREHYGYQPGVFIPIPLNKENF